MNKEQKYMNPYLAGIILGMVLVGSVYLSGRGLGASGALKSVVMQTMSEVAPERYNEVPYYASYAAAHEDGGPMKSWLVFEVIGVVLGAAFSGIASGRMKLKFEKGPNITKRTRVIAAIIGGMLFGIGSQLGRGCTSGSALSGMAVMSAGGILTMLFIFGGGYMMAYFFRRLWL
ncbi:YeeE/YedE thiosulfate transporter family protein [Algivirga pacifica]|uniref:YeeE/YedE thiosulfate transporter family protein n=1 Tax=Algivirga pacifica TaxID=1162670 RepID=A0ABP9D9Z8_9BACT